MATFLQSCIREVYPREIQIQKHFLHFLVVNKVFCPFSVSGGINFSAYVLKMAHKMGISSRESLLIVVSYIAVVSEYPEMGLKVVQGSWT